MQKKRTSYKPLILVVFFPLVLMGVGFAFCCRSQGFNLEKISSKLTYNELWGVPPMNQGEVSSFVRNVFSQPFYYLGAGDQCYAFQSEDGQFVLKFFKMHQLLPKDWLNDFPFSLFENYRFNNVEKRKQLIQEVFSSIKGSYEHLQEETGLLFIHLNKSRDLKTKAILFDKVGKKYQVDLDSKEFFLQKKAVKIYDHLLELMKQGEDERVHRCIRSLLQVVVARCEQGFADLDIGVRNNYGFVGDQAVIIDCGSLVLDETIRQPHHYQREILRVAEAMDHWAQTHFPELVPIIQDEAHFAINSILEK
jgi:hypothetical protein